MSKILFSVLPICCVLLFQPPAWAQVTGNHPCVGPCVLTFHYDLARDGVNGSETVLTPSAIKPAGAFGKVAAINGLRGEIYAQPLYMSGLNSVSSKGNLVFVATEQDHVYAFDADTYQMVWGKSYLPSGEVPLSTGTGGDVACTDTGPNIGITSTPVIDPNTNLNSNPAIYFVTTSVDLNKNYHQRLHAADVTSGAELFGGPVEITTPPGSSVPFSPILQLQRSSLVLTHDVNNNPQVYVAWGSNCDQGAFHGWVMKFGVNNNLLGGVPSAFLVTTPSGKHGGVWGAGAALAADNPVNGNLYISTGDGSYDGSSNFGSSVIKLSSDLNIVDWYTSNDYQCLNGIKGNSNCRGNVDLGSGGVTLFNVPNGVPEMAVAGKRGEVYVIYQSNLGHLDPAPHSPTYAPPLSCTTGPPPPIGGPNNIAQCFLGMVNLAGIGPTGSFATAAFWNNTLYTVGSGDALRAYPLSSSDIGTFKTTAATAVNPARFPFPGASPVVSWNGTQLSTGILWVLQTSTYLSGNPTLLQAYNPIPNGSNVLPLLYSSSSTGPGGVKFVVPTVANGKVFVAGQGVGGGGAEGRLYVYGLCPCIGPVLKSISPNSGTSNGGNSVTLSGTNFGPGATVSFGGIPATNVNVVNNTTITVTTPPHSAGVTSVTVTNSDGNSATYANAFTYDPAIQFVQVKASTPVAASSVAITYPSSQTAGDLNVIVVGWNDAISTITSVQDSAGNVYSLAAPILRTGSGSGGSALSQAIYYAAKVVSGANTVTVTFNQSASHPDIRILEYRGASSFDVNSSATGTSNISNSGAATITAPNELIFGANTIQTVTAGPGAGFTSRIITSTDGNIAEDEFVSTMRAYSATATLTSSGAWVMQMVTFK